MKSFNTFWNEERKRVAGMCEEKNARLFYDVLDEIYYIVKKFSDGSVLHTKDTQLFKSRNIVEVEKFITSFQ